VACLAFLARREWLTGIALGFLAFKPQFLVAIPLVLLLAKAWKAFAGLALSAGIQLASTYFYFGPGVMRLYLDRLLYSAGRPGSAELRLSPIQMHSLYSFWELMIPWPRGVWALYLLSSLAVVAMAGAVWKSSAPAAVRFSALILAAVLVNPHIYIYDLLALVPVFLLVTDWVLSRTWASFNSLAGPAPDSWFSALLYLSFVLPLLGPLSRWTRVQLSVPVFIVLLWMLWRCRAGLTTTAGHILASRDSRVV
jgi:hypothetical protein